MKRIISLVLCLLLLFSVSTYADEDNADSGGNVGQSHANHGFYRTSQNMWKVSVYVGKKDTTNLGGSIDDFYRIGKPVFIQGFNNFISGYTIISSPYNKFDYLKGKRVKIVDYNNDAPRIIRADAPAIPVSHNGNIEAVKAYFGNTSTLRLVLDAAGRSIGMDVKDYLIRLIFEVEGKLKKLSADEVMPKVVGGKALNKVPYLIMYEPIAVTYLRRDKGGRLNAVAYTATEYALTNGNTFNWNNSRMIRPPFQDVNKLTNRQLPASVVLKKSWLGYKAVEPDSVHNWGDRKIIEGGGFGMRFLSARKSELKSAYITSSDTVYRTDTDVITSLKVHTKHRSNRIDKFNPLNRAKVTFDIGGKKATHTFILPDGGECYSFVKWHTPKNAGEVTITVTPSRGLYFDDGSNKKVIKAKILNLSSRRPPDPEANDKGEIFDFKNLPTPTRTERKIATWHEYIASWHTYWVDNGWWVDDEDKPKNPDGTYQKKWHYDWDDEGWWDWSKKTYYLSADANVKIKPSAECPTPKKVGSKWYMKSGYSFNTDLNVFISTNAPSTSHYTRAGNVISTFPEFNYETYLRVLEKHGTNSFYFKENIYSQWLARSHFTPLWFPDGEYRPYYEVIDIWTPDGMLKVNVSDSIKVRGNIYDDWHISAEEVN